MTESDTLLCGAKLRQGGHCALPPAADRRRCFQHGGARGIGAPKGSRNAWKHGVYSREQIALRQQINAFFRECLQTMRGDRGWHEGPIDGRVLGRLNHQQSGNRLGKQCDRVSDRTRDRVPRMRGPYHVLRLDRESLSAKVEIYAAASKKELRLDRESLSAKVLGTPFAQTDWVAAGPRIPIG